MFVYIATEEVYMEGSTLIRVCSTMAKAKKACEEFVKDDTMHFSGKLKWRGNRKTAWAGNTERVWLSVIKIKVDGDIDPAT